MSKRIFITGGASGLGRSLAMRYAADGYKVCIGDINDERSEETVADIEELGGTIQAHRVDVTDDASMQAIADHLKEDWGGVDIVVNNAGVAVLGAIADEPMSSWQWVMDINVLGVVRGIRAFAPMMEAAGSGHFVNVASMAGLVHPPKSGGYSASKAAVVALSESLAIEMRPKGIGVSVVCPMFFETNLGESLRTEDRETGKLVGKLLLRSKIDADDIADMIFDGVRRNKLMILPHTEGKISWMAKRFMPRSWYMKMVEKQTRAFMQ